MKDAFLLVSLSFNAALIWLVYELVTDGLEKSKELGTTKGYLAWLMRQFDLERELFLNNQHPDQLLKSNIQNRNQKSQS